MTQIILQDIHDGLEQPQKNDPWIKVIGQQFGRENISYYKLDKVYFDNCIWKENALLDTSFVDCIFRKNTFESNVLQCEFRNSYLSSVEFNDKSTDCTFENSKLVKVVNRDSDSLKLYNCVIESGVIDEAGRIDIRSCVVLAELSKGFGSYISGQAHLHSQQLGAFYTFMKWVSNSFGLLEGLTSNSSEVQKLRADNKLLEEALSKVPCDPDRAAQIRKVFHDPTNVAEEYSDFLDLKIKPNVSKLKGKDVCARQVLSNINSTSGSFANTCSFSSLELSKCCFTSHCFEQTTIVSGKFDGCHFKGIHTKFNEATFDFSDFEDCVFYPNRKGRNMLIENCSFMACNFSGTSFKNCKFKNVDFRFIRGLNEKTFDSCTFDSCIFDNSEFIIASSPGEFAFSGEFTKCTISNFCFAEPISYPKIKPATFTKCTLRRVIFQAGRKFEALHFHKTTFDNCTFSHAEFRSSTFNDASYKDCGFGIDGRYVRKQKEALIKLNSFKPDLSSYSELARRAQHNLLNENQKKTAENMILEEYSRSELHKKQFITMINTSINHNVIFTDCSVNEKDKKEIQSLARNPLFR